MKPVYIESRDIPDAWFQCINAAQQYGFKHEIQHGSRIGQTRIEFDWITVYIKHPYAEPYDLMLPYIPDHLWIPNPVAPGYVEQYVPYLMTAEKAEREDYTYGERLSGYKYFNIISEKDSMWESCYIDQIDHFIELLKETPNTNQAILQVAQPQDCLLGDPPCLRHIDIRIKDKYYKQDGEKYYIGQELIFYPYFRSWDLWGGFPANLAGIAVLQKYMADEIGVENGPIICSSKGLHLYGDVEEFAKLRTGRIND